MIQQHILFERRSDERKTRTTKEKSKNRVHTHFEIEKAAAFREQSTATSVLTYKGAAISDLTLHIGFQPWYGFNRTYLAVLITWIRSFSSFIGSPL